MKKLAGILLTLALTSVINGGAARAEEVVLSFENVPDAYLYRAGNQNLGTYYSGLNFGPQVTVLDQARYGYNSTDFPPHTGNAVIWGDYVDQPLRVDFLGFQSTSVEAWYTSLYVVHLNAYDSADNLLASTASPINYPGQVSLISVSAPNIAYVTFYNNGMNYLSLDDLAYTPVPEPSTVALLALGAGGLVIGRRRR